jgi:hypothetical protein
MCVGSPLMGDAHGRRRHTYRFSWTETCTDAQRIFLPVERSTILSVKNKNFSKHFDYLLFCWPPLQNFELAKIKNPTNIYYQATRFRGPTTAGFTI